MNAPREGVIHDPGQKVHYNGSLGLIRRNDWSLVYSKLQKSY